MAEATATQAVAQADTKATPAAQAAPDTTTQQAAAQAAQTPATTAPAATPETQTAGKPAETILNKIEPSGDVVPEKYEDFKVPEGFNAPQESFKTFAKELGMSQEKAQKTIDYY